MTITQRPDVLTTIIAMLSLRILSGSGGGAALKRSFLTAIEYQAAYQRVTST
jgi:hypothetical protein